MVVHCAGGGNAVLSNATMRVDDGRAWVVAASVAAADPEEDEDEAEDDLGLDMARSKRSRTLWGNPDMIGYYGA